jgi:hypothetical protein
MRILARIVRCYAELQRDELLVREFFTLLEGTEALVKSGGSAAEMEQILASAITGLDGYAASQRSRILVDIAEARWREAAWNTAGRSTLLAKAIAGFERAEAEAGAELDPELRLAIRIGLARACLLAGDAVRGEQLLTEVVQARDRHPREAALALKLLLEHYRAQGRYDEALQEYQAYAGEGSR